MNEIVLYISIKILIGLFNAAYWEKRAMKSERISLIVEKKYVKPIYVTMHIIASVFILLLDTIPDLYKRLKQKI